MERVYNWDDKDLPNVKIGSPKVIWWDDDEICIDLEK